MTTPFCSSSSATLSHCYNSLAPNVITKFGRNFNPFIARPVNTFRSSRIKASSFSSSPYPTLTENEKALSIDALQRFIELNLGNWIGSFYQFDPEGNLMNEVTTKLAVSSYGEDDLVSLIQTLYIQQPPSSSSDSEENREQEWAEYKIKETNMFTVDKYQQINIFPNEKAFALRYQTAGMLETVLRQGVLGEDDIGEEFPKNLKLPSRRPAIVCETCLFSLEKDMRARAFHIMDPKGREKERGVERDVAGRERERGVERDVFVQISPNFTTRHLKLDKAMDLYRDMACEGLRPTVVTHNILLHGLCQLGEPLEALTFFYKFQGQNPDIVTYETLLDGLCKNRDVDKALSLFHLMRFHGLIPDRNTFNIIIRGCLRNKKYNEACKVVDKMVDCGFLADAFTTSLLQLLLSKVQDPTLLAMHQKCLDSEHR